MDLKLISLSGKEVQPYISDLTKLRIRIFKEYPYLYDGTVESEEKYLSIYTASTDKMLALVLDGDRLVGVSTAMPLVQVDAPELQQPFIKEGMNVNDIFYFGESLLDKQYRGQGVYRYFFEAREKAAKQYGARLCTFCAVIRSENDPRKPSNYVPLNEVWQHFGYQQCPDLIGDFSWKEVDSQSEVVNKMIFWVKEI